MPRHEPLARLARVGVARVGVARYASRAQTNNWYQQAQKMGEAFASPERPGRCRPGRISLS
jgi:predicted Rossmann-fold nucleotide-binding protein